ncbi:MAG: hypothetical protein Q8L97_05915 [Nitrosomonas sp.]|uniref:hypothetical protein n=1 Tax=Nitrosomonas sp. TaxID=42353 RepID=UPI0027314152|nr:hypothetical protein [Nitrosomonas sp.]MDP1549680.1 hypothetical protein [Nitrosomonas sp.]
MKKIALILTLLLSSSTCFAIVNFTSSTGNLVMRDVSVDGSTVYDSVTLQLNLANGTFTILDATLKDTSFSETALDTITQNGVKIDFMGCVLSGKNQITCKTKITSINQDQKIAVYGNSHVSGFGPVHSYLFDNLSNQYIASTITALDKSATNLSFSIIQGIPVEVKFIYNDINPSATSISSFQPYFWPDTGAVLKDFTDIDF